MKRAVIILVVIIVLAVIGRAWYSHALRPTGASQTAVTVAQGEGSSAIAADLQSKHLIHSSLAFRLHAKFAKLGAKFKAGRYVVSGAKSTTQIANELTDPSQSTNQFTIREGLTQKQIATTLGKLGIVDENEFANLKAKDFNYDFLADAPDGASLEGFLFPETYTIPPPGASAHDVATIMLNQFGKELTPSLRSQIKAQKRTIYDTVTIASIVEREVTSENDRKVVAGIFWKRLDQNIALGADTTLLYGLGKTGNYELTQSDLQSDNKYNTRKLKGLPPSPIDNPGLSALTAAVNPSTSDFLFYLTGSDGKTYYAKTNDEQEANKAKYLK